MSPQKNADLYISTKFLGLEYVLAIGACLVVHGHHVLDGHVLELGKSETWRCAKHIVGGTS